MTTIHPWNTDFAWPEHRAGTTVTADQAAAFDRDGFFVAPDLFTPDELVPVEAALDTSIDLVNGFLATQENERFTIAEKGAITFAPNLVQHADVLADFVRHPTLLGLAGDLLGPDVNLYWDQAVYKYPDKPRSFPWHQDTGYKFTVPQDYLTVWIAINDATEANGCPQVASGAHRTGTLLHRFVDPIGFECFDATPDDVEQAPVRAGGAVVFSSVTPHQTGPNTSEGVRKAYIVQYARAGTVARDYDGKALTDLAPQDDPAFQFPVLRNGEPVQA